MFCIPHFTAMRANQFSIYGSSGISLPKAIRCVGGGVGGCVFMQCFVLP
jgi:hypothetical protein